MKFIVVGSGNVGLRHASNALLLRPAAEVSLVARQRPENLPEGVGYMASLDEALAEKPTALVLANPCVFHLRDALRGLAAGCHLLIEKPLAEKAEGLAELLAQAEAQRRVLRLGYQLRHHAVMLEMKRQLDAGRIGRLLALHLEAGQYLPDWRPGRDYRQSVSAQRALGGGVLLELSHELDVCTWLAGPSRSVLAQSSQAGSLAMDVEDNAQVVLSLACGAMAMVHMDFLQKPGGRRYRLIGSAGALEWVSSQNAVQVDDYITGQRSVIDCPAAAERNHAYLGELTEFLTAIEAGDATLPQSVKDAAHVVRLVECCRLSSESGTLAHVL